MSTEQVMGDSPLDAAAGLVASLDRAQRAGDLTLRDFRAAVAAAEITSRCAAATAGLTGADAGPRVLAGLASGLVGRASMVFHDGGPGHAGDGRGVVAWSQALVGALRDLVDTRADTAGLHDGRAAADVAAAVQQVAGHLPILADRLVAAVDRWSRTGRLVANARDLPSMEDMPADRVRAVIAGRHVQVHGADLDHLRGTVGRAADLMRERAGVRDGADAPDRRTQGSADRQLSQVRMSVVAERPPDSTSIRTHGLSTVRHARPASGEDPPSP